MLLSLRNKTACVQTQHIKGAKISDSGGTMQICLHLSHSVPMHVMYDQTDEGRKLAGDDFDRIISAMSEEF